MLREADRRVARPDAVDRVSVAGQWRREEEQCKNSALQCGIAVSEQWSIEEYPEGGKSGAWRITALQAGEPGVLWR